MADFFSSIRVDEGNGANFPYLSFFQTFTHAIVKTWVFSVLTLVKFILFLFIYPIKIDEKLWAKSATYTIFFLSKIDLNNLRTFFNFSSLKNFQLRSIIICLKWLI